MAHEHAIIKVIGVGGGGSNAVNRMIEAGIQGTEFIVMNTDAQALSESRALQKMRLGQGLTRGLGAGGNPDVGRSAAQESRNEIRKCLEGADLVFITAGMGGGTGTGAAPIIASIARELGILSVAVVTKPFLFEGKKRERNAEEGIQKLIENVDTMITIPNDKLSSIVEKKTSLMDAFHIADDILRQGVQGISDIILTAGQINVDFADVKAIMSHAGQALMGIGYGSGEKRALQAAQAAINSPLLESTIHGAKGLLVNISGSADLTLSEAAEAMHYITSLCDQNSANVYFGTVEDPTLKSQVRVTVIATDFATKYQKIHNIRASASEETNKFLSAISQENYARYNEVPLPSFLDNLKKDQPSQEESLVDSMKTNDSSLSDSKDDVDIPSFLKNYRKY